MGRETELEFLTNTPYNYQLHHPFQKWPAIRLYKVH